MGDFLHFGELIRVMGTLSILYWKRWYIYPKFMSQYSVAMVLVLFMNYDHYVSKMFVGSPQ